MQTDTLILAKNLSSNTKCALVCLTKHVSSVDSKKEEDKEVKHSI